MASPSGQFHPGRLVAIFVGITAVLYALVLFTPGDKTPRLGIDLQGGNRVVLKAALPGGGTPPADSMKQARNIMEARVNGSGVSGAQVQIDGSDQLVITAPGDTNLDGYTRSAQLNIREVLDQGYDLAGVQEAASAVSSSGTGTGTGTTSAPRTIPAIGDTGAPASGAPTTTAAPSASGTSQGLRGPAEALATGSAAPSAPASGAGSSAPASGSGAPTSGTGTTAVPQGEWPIPGSDPANPNQPAGTDATAWSAWETAAKTQIENGTLSCGKINVMAGQDDPARPLLACGTGKWDSSVTGTSPCGPDVTDTCVTLLDKTLIPGKDISNAASVFDAAQCGGWCINVSFSSSGLSVWSTYTANNVGKQTAFTLDGAVLSAPSVRQAITTAVTQVSGNFSQASATSLANSLKYGALPLQFKQIDSERVSAQLGLEYLKAGLIAGGIGLALVIIYCLVYYRLLGVITILSLVLSFGLVYAVMVLLGRWIGLSLDMAGVAGLIVSIGITADSFVIYFERLKDEVREGRSFRSAVPRGWERAKRTILSADAVTFLSALVLYLVAVGDVKGFAFTLGLSTVLDLVVVFLVTHPLVAWASGAKIFTSPALSGLGAVAKAGAAQRAAAARLNVKEA